MCSSLLLYELGQFNTYIHTYVYYSYIDIHTVCVHYHINMYTIFCAVYEECAVFRSKK